MRTRVLVWDGFALREVDAAGGDELEIVCVDSYRSRLGRVVARELHERRFAAVASKVVDEASLRGFFTSVRDELTADADLFPRLECWRVPSERELNGEASLILRVRPCPPIREHTSVWIPPTADPRLVPTIKGPDLDILGTLRAQAVEAGADDAALVTGDGYILELANAALLFCGSDGLVLPGSAEQRLPSTTVEAARREGYWVDERLVALEEAYTLPAVAASALHGFTPVSEWIISSSAAPSSEGDSREISRSIPAADRQRAAAVAAELNAAIG